MRCSSIEDLSVGVHNLMKNIVISSEEDNKFEAASPKVFEMESIAEIFNSPYDRSKNKT